ncbi:hypothetical protein GOBAR_DD17075 [Gossypium barbadense]|nr:hypothetical protein GOBAR_DD17075 [Gossypium barbadense]
MGNILLDGLQWSTTSGILKRNLSISNEKNCCAMDIVSRSLAWSKQVTQAMVEIPMTVTKERKRMRLKLPLEGWCKLNTDGAVMKEIDHFSCRDAECRHFMKA